MKNARSVDTYYTGDVEDSDLVRSVVVGDLGN